jgi:plastocyanin
VQEAAGVRRICLAASVAVLAAGVVAVGAPGTLAKATKPKVVKVKDNFYAPDSLRIRKGSKVKWDWTPTFNQHNVTLRKGPNGVRKKSFRSQTSNDPSFFFTKRFKKVGKYRFYCTIHPDVMRMTVRVHR